MTTLKKWKLVQWKRWNQLPLQQRSGWLVGLIALGATMTAVSATQLTSPAFWRGFITGIWASDTLILIGFLALIQFQARKR